MTNRGVTIALLGIVVAIFLSFVIGFSYFLPDGEPITSGLKDIQVYASQGKWEEAQQTMTQVEKDWNRIKFFLKLNYAESEYALLLEYMGRLKSGVQQKEATPVITDAGAILEVWTNIVRVIPEP